MAAGVVMRQFQSTSDLQEIVHPTCAKCGAPMWLTRIEPDGPGLEKRTFECQACQRDCRSRQISIAQASAMQYDRLVDKQVAILALKTFWVSFTLAIEHISAYICGITDQTLGVSG